MWIQPVDTIELVVKGLLVGIVASAPMGPVGVLTVQRTLKKGRWYGMVTGVGAAFSDIIYAIITGVGLAFVIDFIEDPKNLFWLKVIGSVVLFLFGVVCALSRPPHTKRPTSANKGSIIHNGVTGFLITLSNPLIVFLFIAMMARLDLVLPEHYWEQALVYLSIFGGALLWWFGLTLIIDKARARFHVNTIHKLNRLLGVIIVLVSLYGFVTTILPKL